MFVTLAYELCITGVAGLTTLHAHRRAPVNTKRFTSFLQGVGGWVQTTTAAARALAADTDVLLTVLGRPWATKSAPLRDGIHKTEQIIEPSHWSVVILLISSPTGQLRR